MSRIAIAAGLAILASACNRDTHQPEAEVFQDRLCNGSNVSGQARLAHEALGRNR